MSTNEQLVSSQAKKSIPFQLSPQLFLCNYWK